MHIEPKKLLFFLVNIKLTQSYKNFEIITVYWIAC